jgi:alkanesulfonate monooxygenase SsuD/methylene tetrahydromethanopterin reductase-like flavin-dependent oxidoreductase (luciferase family)
VSSVSVTSAEQAADVAEEVGFDAILVNDHIIVDSSSRAAP